MGKVVEIRTRSAALSWGDEQAAYALRLRGQLERTEEALRQSRIMEKATQTLLEFAEAEIKTLRGIIDGD